MYLSTNVQYQRARAHLETLIDAWPGLSDHAALIAAQMYLEESCTDCGSSLQERLDCVSCRMIGYLRSQQQSAESQPLIADASDAAWQAAIAGCMRAVTAVTQLQQVGLSTARTHTYLGQLLRTVSALSAETLTISDLIASVIIIDI